jgi:hypothetical protein
MKELVRLFLLTLAHARLQGLSKRIQEDRHALVALEVNFQSKSIGFC